MEIPLPRVRRMSEEYYSGEWESMFLTLTRNSREEVWVVYGTKVRGMYLAHRYDPSNLNRDKGHIRSILLGYANTTKHPHGEVEMMYKADEAYFHRMHTFVAHYVEELTRVFQYFVDTEPVMVGNNKVYLFQGVALKGR